MVILPAGGVLLLDFLRDFTLDGGLCAGRRSSPSEATDAVQMDAGLGEKCEYYDAYGGYLGTESYPSTVGWVVAGVILLSPWVCAAAYLVVVTSWRRLRD